MLYRYGGPRGATPARTAGSDCGPAWPTEATTRRSGKTHQAQRIEGRTGGPVYERRSGGMEKRPQCQPLGPAGPHAEKRRPGPWKKEGTGRTSTAFEAPGADPGGLGAVGRIVVVNTGGEAKDGHGASMRPFSPGGARRRRRGKKKEEEAFGRT